MQRRTLAKSDAQRSKQLLCMDAGILHVQQISLAITFPMSCSKLSHLHYVNNLTTWHCDHLESKLGTSPFSSPCSVLSIRIHPYLEICHVTST